LSFFISPFSSFTHSSSPVQKGDLPPVSVHHFFIFFCYIAKIPVFSHFYPSFDPFQQLIIFSKKLTWIV